MAFEAVEEDESLPDRPSTALLCNDTVHRLNLLEAQGSILANHNTKQTFDRLIVVCGSWLFLSARCRICPELQGQWLVRSRACCKASVQCLFA